MKSQQYMFDDGPGFLKQSDINVSGINDADWKRKHAPRVVFDSGWYDHNPGDPLPDIETFRVPT